MIKLNKIMRSGIEPPSFLANYFMYRDINHYFRNEISSMLEMANNIADEKGLEDDT